MASSARIDEIKKKFDENPRRYFAPLANEFRKAGDLEQAIVICEEFLPQQAGHMSGHIVYGQALFESGRLPESRTVFETALGLDPENLIALRHLGDIARSEGDLDGARRWYDRVLEADPRNEEIQGLITALDAPPGEGALATPSAAAEAPSSADADTLIIPAIPRQQEAPPPLEAIDLDLEGGIFAASDVPAAPAGSEPAAPVVPPPIPQVEHAVEAPGGGLMDFEPTNAEAATASGMPEPGHARAEGLESAEFEAPTTPHHRAEGLEPLEFEAPTHHTDRAEGLEATHHEPATPSSTDDTLLDLESSFELGAGSAASRASTVAPVAGLEESGATPPPLPDVSGLPMLDVDNGPPASSREHPHMEPPAAMEAMPALTADSASGAAALEQSGGMMELPPSVIAAESQLMDAGDLLPMDGQADSASSDGMAGGAAPFVTETMAELYLKQGFRDQALGVFRQLLAANPGDARLRDRVASLEQGEGAPATTSRSGPTVREFFFRLATRQPGQATAGAAPPASDDFANDFASFDAVPAAPVAEPFAAPAAPSAPAMEALPDFDPAPEPESAPESTPVYEPEPRSAAMAEPMTPAAPPARPTPGAGMGSVPSANERGATAQGAGPAGGTIDALFGTRAATSEDSAASALAQAFGGSSDAPAISGRPARAATGELSLDSVFRDAPPRPSRVSQSFSFDQFFSESAAGESGGGAAHTPAGGSPAQGEPAERTADDVQQFNSWLQGLKQQ